MTRAILLEDHPRALVERAKLVNRRRNRVGYSSIYQASLSVIALEGTCDQVWDTEAVSASGKSGKRTAAGRLPAALTACGYGTPIMSRSVSKDKATMTSRFEGPSGQRAIIEVLLEHRLVQHDQAIATLIAGVGSLVTFDDGQSIVTQGEANADVFFILTGEAAVFVNERKIAMRGHRDAIGEMSAIDPAMPRSATVRSSGQVVALKVDEAEFEMVLERSPKLWKPIAKTAAERLRERRRFHRPPNAVPILFVGSSVEGLAVAREVQSQLKHDKVEVRLWTTGVFGPGGISIDSLLEQVAAADFAVFVVGPDDMVGSRGSEHSAPRDNVVFELGLFMGRLGRQRVFILMEHGGDLKLPSDLLGVTPLTFVRPKGTDLSAALGPPCNELRKKVLALGVH